MKGKTPKDRKIKFKVGQNSKQCLPFKSKMSVDVDKKKPEAMIKSSHSESHCSTLADVGDTSSTPYDQAREGYVEENNDAAKISSPSSSCSQNSQKTLDKTTICKTTKITGFNLNCDICNLK